MGKIFVSYSRRDQEQVDHIVKVMEESRMNVWIDRENIKAGKAWRVQIVEAIDTCDAFVLVLSGNSALSDNVRKEIDLAQDSGRVIFPVMLNPVKLPAEIRYQLAGLQFLDVQMLGFEEGVRQLITTLNEHLEKVVPQKPTVRQTELVIQGVDLDSFGEEKKAQLLGFIAQLCNADQANLSIANMTAGSVHVFVDMPATNAFTLKTMALNREKRFKQMGITSLRILGDSKFVNIALGVLTTTATIGILNLLWLSLPSLFPSMFGVVAGKVIVAASVVTVTTLAGVAVSNAEINIPLFDPTPTSTIQIPITGDLNPTETFTPLPISTEPPTASQEKTILPTETMTASPTSTLTFTFTPSPTLTPSATDTPTYTPTYTPTPSSTNTPTHTPSASPTVSSAGFSISNVQLNSLGSSITVAAGSLVSVSLNYQVWNQSACPSCIDQIVIGLDATSVYCAYHGIPGVAPGVSSSNNNTISAPSTSGTYTLYAYFVQYYTCADALALNLSGTPIGTITVSTPLTNAGYVISNVQLNGSGSVVTVPAGSLVSVSLNYQVWNQSNCPACIDQIVIGLDATSIYCAYHGIPGVAPGVSSSNNNTISAPSASGVYALYSYFVQYYTCADALALNLSGTQIGTIMVP